MALSPQGWHFLLRDCWGLLKGLLFRNRFPRPEDDCIHMRIQPMNKALAHAAEHVAGVGLGPEPSKHWSAPQ